MAPSSFSAAEIHVHCGAGFASHSKKSGFFSHCIRSSGTGVLPRSAFLKTTRLSVGRGCGGPVRVVNEKVVGIDLGTTNSAVAVMEGGKPIIVPNAEGQRTTPSVVAYTKNGDLLVGENAKSQALVNPENTFFSVKKFIGRKLWEVDEESKQVSYRVAWDKKGDIRLECPAIGKRFAPEEISAMVIRKLVDDASKFLNDKVTKAVVTVPAYFNVSQRTATKDAGRIAGLEVLQIINEPTAASLAYGFNKRNNETILVFDLGGGTFDVSVLEVGDGVFEVLSTSGDTHLGGDDFDKRIVDWLASNFKRDEGIDLLKDEHLNKVAEKAKMELSSLTQTNIRFPRITLMADDPKHIGTNLTRAKFEELCSDLLERLRTSVDSALRDAKLSLKDVDEVILVGGSTRIPAVQELVKKMTGKEPNVTVNPDEVVALGAAVQAGVLTGDVSDIVLLDVTPLSFGLETLGGVMTKIVPRNTTLPTSKFEVFSTEEDGQTSVRIAVFQGESEFARDNKSLGTLSLHGILPAPLGVPRIEVKFDIDADGILSITAIDKGTGKRKEITLTGANTWPTDRESTRSARELELSNMENAMETMGRLSRLDEATSIVNAFLAGPYLDSTSVLHYLDHREKSMPKDTISLAALCEELPGFSLSKYEDNARQEAAQKTVPVDKFEEVLGSIVELRRILKEAEKFAKEDKEKRAAIDTKNQGEKVGEQLGTAQPVTQLTRPENDRDRVNISYRIWGGLGSGLRKLDPMKNGLS